MNRLPAYLMSLVLALCLGACGGESEPQGDADRGTGTTTGGSGEAPTEGGGAPAPETVTCEETTNLAVQISAEESHPVESFEVTHSTGFISGMSYNGKTVAKLVYVILANYEATVGRYGVEMPTEEGQVVLQLAFKRRASRRSSASSARSTAAMAVEPGEYAPGWMASESTFEVVYYVGGGEGGGPAISGSDATGTATLTVSTPEKACGRIDFTSPKGSTIQGTFNADLVGDLWAR